MSEEMSEDALYERLGGRESIAKNRIRSNTSSSV